MASASSDADTFPTAAPPDGEIDSDLARYRRTCREVDRLLEQGRLSEALRVNEEARSLFRRLFASGQLG